ncbi:S8 family serine peptidase [Lapidilactobacillus luobeiensis]|uniref:S8 family serine peptidase n=1 Tax=Lapidilactobacillus luobeiensis TaxID=2950371 RepID=UPI0021C41078|nr:S8 family serine peptidase [Lapidilactobacillus luobeiensis]
MKHRGKKLSLLLTSTAVLGLLTTVSVNELQVKAAIGEQAGKQASTNKTKKKAAEQATTSTTEKAISAQLAAQGIDYSKYTPAQKQDVYVDVIVQLNQAPAAENGSVENDYSSTAEIQQASDQVIAAQASVKQQVQAITKQGVSESYGYVVNGFVTKAKVRDLAKLQAIAGVKTVTLAKVYYTTDAKANEMGNVQSVWSSYKYKGEKTVVSVIDTGIDPNHKDMRLSDESNVKLTKADASDFAAEAGHGQYFTAKVPYGFNYADNNNIITDDDPAEQHGMHVAGIVGANGTGSDPTTSVVGVAPEAQLLAMKVFTNSDTSSTTGSATIVSAIEDSAKIGADVLNMSLGSTSGSQTLADPEQAAVQNAIDAGTAAVISAGNEGTTGSDQEGVNKDYYGLPDSETVGTPGTSRSATTVASAENVEAISEAVTITNNADADFKLGPEAIQLSDASFETAFDQKQFYVVKNQAGELGVGSPDQYSADVKGKIAIVLRGDLAFTEKQANAKKAGAAGLIIVNSADTADPLTSIQLTTDFPSFGLAGTTGRALAKYVDEGHADTAFNVGIGLAQLPNQLVQTDRMSTFTSYGPVSDLSFKPDITAPGGNIWSTQNNNGYINMSGTSMASPFIAGTQALLKQSMTNKDNPFYELYQGLSGAETVDLIKAIEMNTARPVHDADHGEVIESPRRQGAGLVDVDAAIKALETNPSTVVSDNGYPAIELKDFSSTEKTFTLTFTNRTKNDLTYQLDQNEDTNAVYTSATDPADAILYDQAIAGASIKANEPIKVPAGQKVQVSLTLSLPEDLEQQQYIEGFLAFAGSDGSRLSIPYLGFYGNWGQDKFFDTLNGLAFSPQGTGNYGTTALGRNTASGNAYYLGLTTDDKGYAYVDEDAIAFSTDSRAFFNEIQFDYYLFRNAQNVSVDILDADNNVVTTLGKSTNLTKTYFYSNGGYYTTFTAPSWDGTYYDQATGDYKTVADGTYSYRLTGTPEGSDQEQSYSAKFKVDSVAPTIRNIGLDVQEDKDGKTYYATAEVKDSGSGLDIDRSAITAINGIVAQGGKFEVEGSTADGYSKVTVPLTTEQAQALTNGKNTVELYLTDNATNAADEMTPVQKPGETSYDLVLLNGGIPEVLSTATPDVISLDAGTYGYRLTGTYPGKVYGTYTDENGQEQTLDVSKILFTNYFNAILPLTAGKDYDSTVTLYSDEDHETPLGSYQTRVSLTPPAFAELNVASGTSEQEAPVSGTVSADTVAVQVAANGKTITADLDADHHFTATVPVVYGDNELTFTAIDADGNTTTATKTIKSSNDPDLLNNAVTFDHGVKFGSNNLSLADTSYYDPETGIATITGHVKHNTTTLKIDGKDVQINPDDLSFSVKLELGHAGQKPFSVIVGDTTQNKTFQETLSFLLDTEAPVLNLNNPTDQVVKTNDPNYTVSGTATDNVDYFDLYINGSNVDATYSDIDINSGKSGKLEFSKDITLNPGINVITVTVTDSMGNPTTKQIHVDYRAEAVLTAPTISENTKEPATSVTLTAEASATDETVEYSTDGGQTYQAVPAEGVVVKENGNVLFKSTDGYGNESPVVTYNVSNISATVPTDPEDPDDSDAAALKEAKTALREALTHARELGASGDYTHDSAQALAAARAAVQAVLNDKEATLADVQAAAANLKAAEDALIPKADDPAAATVLATAKAELRTKLAEARDLGKSGKYTHATALILAQAREAVVAILNKSDATLAEVQTTTAQLEAAIKGLELKSGSTDTTEEEPAKDPDQTEKPTTGANQGQTSGSQTNTSAQNQGAVQKTSTNAAKTVKASKAKQTNAAKLPQAGEQVEPQLGLWGIILASLAGLLGLGKRQRRHD